MNDKDMPINLDYGAEKPQMSANQKLADMALKEMDMNERAQTAKQMASEKPAAIGADQVRKAMETLKKYKDGKARLEAKLIADEEFFKKHQWRYLSAGESDDKKDKRFEPATPWLFSCLQSRYADTMDSYPTCNIVPRQGDDKEEARILSQIIPVILQQNDYEETYSDIAWYMLKHGGCIQAILWDGNKHNGLGDIAVKKVDFLNFFAEPGITDIQKSPNVFTTELVDNDLLVSRYPQCEGKLGKKSVNVSKYIYDDKIPTDNKSVVVDWYYKKVVNGKETLQYVKFVNEVVLYATENDVEIPMTTETDEMTGITFERPMGESMASRGLYDHAKYPFVVQPLVPVEGSLCGYGLIDIGRDTQLEIDLLNRAITENAIAAAKPRYFARIDGAINEEEFCDMDREIVHVNTSLSDEAIRPIECKQLSGIYLETLQMKIEELKFCTANQDVNNGSAPSGITAGSAIAALQETAGKVSRSVNKNFHRCFREVVYFVIELIRQFYDTPRMFRIIPDALTGEQYVSYSNEGIRPQPQMLAGQNMGFRVPEFDIEVTVEKDSPYKKMEMNELALNFYGNGFFNPQLTDQALATLDMMDFQKKEEIMQKIAQNGTIFETMARYMQLALNLAQQSGDAQLADAIAQDITSQLGGQMPSGGVDVSLQTEGNEHPFNEKARSQARESTQAE